MSQTSSRPRHHDALHLRRLGAAVVIILAGIAACRAPHPGKSATGDTESGDDTGSADTAMETEDTGDSETSDADRDGWITDEDCDDSDLEVHPGADEACDAVDSDCDGEVEACSTEVALYTIEDTPATELRSAGDIDGDGQEDLLVGIPGAWPEDGTPASIALVLAGDLKPGSQELASVTRLSFLEGAAGFYAYAVTAAGDVDEDGLGDVFLAGTRTDNQPGIGYVTGSTLIGSVEITTDDAAQWRTLDPSVTAVLLESSLGDIDGDGMNEIALGILRDPADETVVVSARRLLDSAEALRDPDWTLDRRIALQGAGDLDGDGLADISGTLSRGDCGTGVYGCTWVWSAETLSSTSSPTPEDADAAFYPSHTNDYLSHAPLAFDLDGDGRDEMVVHAVTWATNSNIFYLVRNPLDMSSPTSLAEANVTITSTEDLELGSLTPQPPFAGDEHGALAFGAFARDSSSHGALVVLLGASVPTSGTIGPMSGDWLIHGVGPLSPGREIAIGPGDIDGDGASDLLTSDGSASYIFSGAGLP